MRSKLILILAIVMGLVTTYLFYTYMQEIDHETVSLENMEEIVVAKQDIKKNQELAVDMVELQTVPSNYIPTGAIRNVEDVNGSFLTTNITKGEYITTSRIQKKQDEELLVSRKIKEGFRAVSIGTDIIKSVSNLIEPDDAIDIIFSEAFPMEGGGTRVETQLLLSKVRVLAVGKRMVENDSVMEEVEYSSLTLELKPEDTVKIVNASERGNLHLTIHTRIVPPKGVEKNGSPK